MSRFRDITRPEVRRYIPPQSRTTAGEWSTEMLWSTDNTGSFLKRVAAVAALAALAASAHAGPREQAKRIHDRIAGVPPSAAVLTAMEDEITAGDTEAAAMIAMDNPSFYSVTLKNLVDAVDEPRAVRVRAAQRLHGDRDRHGARRPAVQPGAVGRRAVRRQRRPRPAGRVTCEQRSLRADGNARRQPADRAAAYDAVRAYTARRRPRPRAS